MKFRKLKKEEIECRPALIKQTGLSLLLYKDARVDQNMLDESVGAENWQRKHEMIGSNLYCSVGIYIERRDEWVWKQDVGTESNTEKEKGQASDSFKRACFNWGIGRELYTAPFIWISNKMIDIEEQKGKWTTKEKFHVEEIKYNKNGEIELLKIANESGRIVYTYDKNKKTEMPKMETPQKTMITEIQAAALTNKCLNENINISKLCGHYKVKNINELTSAQHSHALQYWNDIVAAFKEGE